MLFPKYNFLIVIAVSLFFFCSCTNENISITTETIYDISQPMTNESIYSEIADIKFESESLLKSILSDMCSGKIIFWNYDDYDGDSVKEAFAVTEESGHRGLWYINSQNAVELSENVVFDTIFVFSVTDEKKFLCLTSQLYENYSLIWGVVNNEAVEMPVSNVGQRFSILDNHNFIIFQSSNDSMSLGGGHTHKPYYFYYDYSSNCFCEYGGTEITAYEFKEFENAEKIIKLIEDNNGKITSILKRNNGIININYSVEDTESIQAINWHYNITLLIKDNSIHYITENEGIYLPALVPEIAVFQAA